MISKASLLAASALAAVAALTAGSARADDCKAIDNTSVPASEWVGRKAWLFEHRHRGFEADPTQWSTTDTFEQTGPAKYTIVGTRLPYGQPVTVVSYLPEQRGPGVAEVELPNGNRHFVNGRAVRFFEFWKCRADVLLEKRRRHPQFNLGEDVYVREAWVRISNPDAKIVDSDRNWMSADRVKKMAFAICHSYNTQYISQIKDGQKPMWCVGYTPGRQGGENFSADAADLETVSPTSMKILFSS